MSYLDLASLSAADLAILFEPNPDFYDKTTTDPSSPFVQVMLEQEAMFFAAFPEAKKAKEDWKHRKAQIQAFLASQNASIAATRAYYITQRGEYASETRVLVEQTHLDCQHTPLCCTSQPLLVLTVTGGSHKYNPPTLLAHTPSQPTPPLNIKAFDDKAPQLDLAMPTVYQKQDIQPTPDVNPYYLPSHEPHYDNTLPTYVPTTIDPRLQPKQSVDQRPQSRTLTPGRSCSVHSHSRSKKSSKTSGSKRHVNACRHVSQGQPQQKPDSIKPTFACQFCYGRKIACRVSFSGETCNQCQQRSIRCEFPTKSRRGEKKRKVMNGFGEGTEDQFLLPGKLMSP